MNSRPAQYSNGSTQLERDVERMLEAAPAYRRLGANAQQELRRDLSKVAAYMAAAPETTLASPYGAPYASQMAPDLKSLLAPKQPGQQTQPVPAQPTAGPTPAGTPAPSQGSATSRAGDVARATLNAIDFPQFVS